MIQWFNERDSATPNNQEVAQGRKSPWVPGNAEHVVLWTLSEAPDMKGLGGDAGRLIRSLNIACLCWNTSLPAPYLHQKEKKKKIKKGRS